MDHQNPPSLYDLGNYLVTCAQTRWLAPEEIYLLLSFVPSDLGIVSLQYPPPIIKDGTLCLYEDGTLCKQDNINWTKKKGQAKLQETYSTLKIHGMELIKAVYIRGADNVNLRRRIYKLNQPDNHITVVHYRECPDDEKAEKTPLHAFVHYYLHRHLLPAYKTTSQQNNMTMSASSNNMMNGFGNNDSSADQYFDDILCDLANDENQNMASATGDLSRQMSTAEMIEIIDFAPVRIRSTDKNTKVLVCISHAVFSNNWQIIFKAGQQHVTLPIESVLPGVLKLSVPVLSEGAWKLFIINELGEKISQDSYEVFTVVAEEQPPATLRKRLHSITSPMSKLRQNNNNNNNNNASNYSGFDGKSFDFAFSANGEYTNSSSSTSALGALSQSHLLPQSGHDEFVRENKIRIVEKLGSMKSALLGEEGLEKLRSPVQMHQIAHDYNNSNAQNHGLPISSSSTVAYPTIMSNSISSLQHTAGMHAGSTSAAASSAVSSLANRPALDTDTTAAHTQVLTAAEEASDGSGGVEWLDDTQLSTLSNIELESLMDRYIMAVVKELVQLAAVDDDLKAEMDSLDANGYSLFHYCCLYNLTSLIPVLIARGVQINQTTASGSTALHLAVAAGHVAVAQLLLESGVDVLKVNAEEMTAYDIAAAMERDDLVRLLWPMMKFTADMAAKNASASADYTSSLGKAITAAGVPAATTTTMSATILTPTKRRPSVRSQSISGTPDVDAAVDLDAGSAASQRLLHDAFATLSLTDKCALSISLSQLTPKVQASPRVTAGSIATNTASSSSSFTSVGIVQAHHGNNSGHIYHSASNNHVDSSSSSSSSSISAATHSILPDDSISHHSNYLNHPDQSGSNVQYSNHHSASEEDLEMLQALEGFDTSYVDMLMNADQPEEDQQQQKVSQDHAVHKNNKQQLPTIVAQKATSSTALPPFPDTFPTSYATQQHARQQAVQHHPQGLSSAGGRSPVSQLHSNYNYNNNNNNNNSSTTLQRSGSHSKILSIPAPSSGTSSSSSSSSISSFTYSHNSNSNQSTAADDLTDIQSVISESDKESLDKAMSLMGQQELVQVEEEVRKIQNNVRGWLLRKNYVNLREAARSLQLAWREKRSRSNAPLPISLATQQQSSAPVNHHGNSITMSNHQQHHHFSATNIHNNSNYTSAAALSSSFRTSSSKSAGHISSSNSTNNTNTNTTHNNNETLNTVDTTSNNYEDNHAADDGDDNDDDGMDCSGNQRGGYDHSDIEMKAAATLQAATRRMIARRSFANLHKHTMASLTIQRNLVRWWTRYSSVSTAAVAGSDDYSNNHHDHHSNNINHNNNNHNNQHHDSSHYQYHSQQQPPQAFGAAAQKTAMDTDDERY